MGKPASPNPLRVGWSILRARRTRPPRPRGADTVDHAPLLVVLDGIGASGVGALPDLSPTLRAYREQLELVDPDELSQSEALAFWLNLYNAGALDLAAEATASRQDTVLRVPGAFRRTWAHIAGEGLSLTDIEHGKIRRFRDPRIHGAMVCGSASCPTLRLEPYAGPRIGEQLDDQLRTFLRLGGASADYEQHSLTLSRVFLWYGGDFTRPRRMPTWLPPRRAKVAAALAPWLDEDTAEWVRRSSPRILFAAYDWGLACSVA